MPLKDWICETCGLEFIDTITKQGEVVDCLSCGKPCTPKISYPATYSIKGNNTASVRPKRMGGK